MQKFEPIVPHISKKKKAIPVSAPLRNYLVKYGRESHVPIHYPELKNFRESITLYDKKGKDTLWETCIYAPADMQSIHNDLLRIYAMLKAGGDVHVMDHLYVDRIDNCLYGNTLPFRIRIVNRVNDNFDYFYVKTADASRIYGLELEHLLSPNRIQYLVSSNTLIEEHIAGIPGDDFVKRYMQADGFNPIRLSKEFIKFNERCLITLLGDMHSSNFVVQITPDFEETNYRIRAIDFDQQTNEGRRTVYMPQFYKQNKPYIDLVQKHISAESITQYQREERSLVLKRMRAAKWPIINLLDAMSRDTLSEPEKIEQLKTELAAYYNSPRFLKAQNMGELLKASLLNLLRTTRVINE